MLHIGVVQLSEFVPKVYATLALALKITNDAEYANRLVNGSAATDGGGVDATTDGGGAGVHKDRFTQKQTRTKLGILCTYDACRTR